MKKQIDFRIVSLVFSILVICFAIVFYVIAWTEPTTTPPGDNVPAPLNTGSEGQAKIGGLILNTGGFPNGLIVDQGKVGIGTTSPSTDLHVVGNVRITGLGLANCTGNKTVDADASGNLFCGTDASGAGGDFHCSDLNDCCAIDGMIPKRSGGSWGCASDNYEADTDTWIDIQTCPSGQYLSSVGKTSKTCSTPSGSTPSLTCVRKLVSCSSSEESVFWCGSCDSGYTLTGAVCQVEYWNGVKWVAKRCSMTFHSDGIQACARPDNDIKCSNQTCRLYLRCCKIQ